MWLASEDHGYMKRFNVDDQIGKREDIPTIIVPKTTSEIIKEYLSTPMHDKVIISIKFTGAKENGMVELDLFFRSDDIKSIYFFKEFQPYYEKLQQQGKLLFNPVYKYHSYASENSSETTSAKEDDSPCIGNANKYCGAVNPSMKISNPRIILLENIRQSCIFTTTMNNGLDQYWKYMTTFADDCADLNNLLFNEDCSQGVMTAVGINEKVVNECMASEVKGTDRSSNDYELYQLLRVRKIPELFINGVKYRGSWYSKYIFEAICSGFLDDHIVCAAPSHEESGISSNVGLGLIILISFGIFLTMLLLLLCYRRFANKSLENTIEEKIQTQTIRSLNQYKAFKQDELLSNQE